MLLVRFPAPVLLISTRPGPYQTQELSKSYQTSAFNKALCFQHILLNTFRQMRLKYKNYSLTIILMQTLKQHSGRCLNTQKNFDGNALEINVGSPI